MITSWSIGGSDVDNEYREAVKSYAQKNTYKDMSEEEVYADVIFKNMHFQYVAFMEMFPNSKHNKEIIEKLKFFNVFAPPQNELFIPLDILDSKYNFDGANETGVYLWRENQLAMDSLNGIRFDHNGHRIYKYVGPVCWGNLQFLDGGFAVKAKNGVVGIELSPSTKILYQLSPNKYFEKKTSKLQALKPAPNQKSVNGRFVTNSTTGTLFVITGKVENPSNISYSHIQIKGTLITKDKAEAKTKLAYCGNIISEEMLKMGTISDINKLLMIKEGSHNANISLPPNASVPFMVVFADLPEKLQNFTVKVTTFKK